MGMMKKYYYVTTLIVILFVGFISITYSYEYTDNVGVEFSLIGPGTLYVDVFSEYNDLGVKVRYNNQDIYIYGMSLGSYTATYSAYTLGKENSFAGLILEVPFDSMYEDVKDLVPFPLPLQLLVPDYNNIPLIKDLHLPLLVMGGQKDTLVPVKHAQALFSAANEPKKLIVYPEAEHGNLFDFANWRDVLNWLREHEKN